jgi:hypothetical protein
VTDGWAKERWQVCLRALQAHSLVLNDVQGRAEAGESELRFVERDDGEDGG